MYAWGGPSTAAHSGATRVVETPDRRNAWLTVGTASTEVSGEDQATAALVRWTAAGLRAGGSFNESGIRDGCSFNI